VGGKGRAGVSSGTDGKRSEKVNWRHPVMRATLAETYNRARSDDEKEARILGVSLGSAWLAKRRHLDSAT
jgi:hypothetical protein